MDLGLPEIVIIVVIVVVLFIGVKMFGDKRSSKSQNGAGDSAKE